ncbi:MAG: HAMP domain-containing sensor histidine kinase [Clostridia bacterium]|nr:HAMP domain-containing sensor histidine kinase [Clostridia bacterium]
MTVKKRLAISNIIMIIIPVVITLFVGLICVGVVYVTLQNTNGFGFESYDEFYNASRTVSDRMYEIFEHGSESSKDRLEFIGNIIDKNTTFVQVYENGKNFYMAGNEELKDANLMESAKSVGTNSFVSNIDHQLFYYTETSNGNLYELYFTANNYHKDNNKAEIVLGVSAVLVVAAIVLSIIFTNRFLTRFVFKKIEEPIDILSAGVKEIAGGNLDYRLSYNKNDEFLPVCIAFNDMAGRLKQSVELAQKNEENRKELLLDISHDLRSPLTSIQAYVEGLIDGVADSPQMRDKYLQTVKRKTIDIEKMVSSLFAYSKLDMEEFAVNEEKILLPDFVEEYADNSRDEYAQKGLDITVESSEKVPVFADRELLTRIVSNILDNSVKYKTKDRAQSRIVISREDGFAKITLSDNGPGVDESSLEKLFEVFYRTDKARSNTGTGSGIGLAFVKKAADAMGGRVIAENNENGGLSIIIYLRCTDE